jgi:hypothetical protein
MHGMMYTPEFLLGDLGNSMETLRSSHLRCLVRSLLSLGWHIEAAQTAVQEEAMLAASRRILYQVISSAYRKVFIRKISISYILAKLFYFYSHTYGLLILTLDIHGAVGGATLEPAIHALAELLHGRAD